MYELKKDNVHKIVETKQQVEVRLWQENKLIKEPKKEVKKKKAKKGED